MEARTFTLLVTITDDAMAKPVTEHDLTDLADRVRRGLEEGVRGFGPVTVATVDAFAGDHVVGAGPRMMRLKVAHNDLREGR